MQKDKNVDCYLNNKKDNVENDDLSATFKKILDKVIKKKGYIEYIIKNNTTLTKQGNYLSILREIDISGKTKDGNKETSVFVKQIIPNCGLVYLNVDNCFHNEAYAYNKLLKIYRELQDKANISFKERYKSPRSFDETNEEAIILENLSKKGFKTNFSRNLMPFEYVELSIKQLAKFHGLSMVLQNQRRDDYYEAINTFKVRADYYHEEHLKIMENFCRIAYKHLPIETGIKLEKYIERYIERIEKHWDTSAVGCCICHGDYKGQNIMYKEEDGMVKEVIAVDFQYLNYGRPINDFMTLVFVETDQRSRKNHMENLKTLYYKSLEQFLDYFNLDVNKIYPRSEYEVHFKMGLEYGLLKSLYILPLTFVEEQEIPDVENLNKFKEVQIKVNIEYKERIQGIVDNCIEWGIIK